MRWSIRENSLQFTIIARTCYKEQMSQVVTIQIVKTTTESKAEIDRTPKISYKVQNLSQRQSNSPQNKGKNKYQRQSRQLKQRETFKQIRSQSQREHQTSQRSMRVLLSSILLKIHKSPSLTQIKAVSECIRNQFYNGFRSQEEQYFTSSKLRII